MYRTLLYEEYNPMSLADVYARQIRLTDILITHSTPTYRTVNTQRTPVIDADSNLNNNIRALGTDIPPIEYTDYAIPKASGGYRQISAPSDDLKKIQRMFYELLHAQHAYPHEAAYAYQPNRTCKSALQKHQQAQTHWFYKFDIHSFFPSLTTDVLRRVLPQIYPFALLTQENLNTLLHIATYHDSLPQGSPLSPFLSNMVMTIFDYRLAYFAEHLQGVYTRYADDMLLSFPTRHQPDWLQKKIQTLLNEIFGQGALMLNTEKTHCGSKAGRNWSLGLMLNNNNDITIGHQRKNILRAKINNFIKDFTNNTPWSIIDTQRLSGEINYFRQIEPEAAEQLLSKMHQKHEQAAQRTLPTVPEMCRQIITNTH